MSLNNKHCLLFLVIFAILLFGVTMASATEVKDVNNMQEIMDDIKLSTPDNHDVDKVVQSSTSQSSTDAEVKNYNTSDKTNYSEISEITNRQTENAIKTNEINITSKNTNLNKNIQQKVKSEGEGSFTELQRLINDNPVIELSQNYQFISGTDDDQLVDGIVINKNLTIYGNGFTIDANNSARIFKISGTDINVVLINIKLINANSTLSDNDRNGGAIYTDSYLWIENCTFTNNGANNGGAVFATKQSDAEYVDNITIDNCNFTENIALVNGGAINIFEKSDNVKILNSNFTNNRVIGYNNSDNTRWYGDGGAICFNKTSTNAVIDNSIFINNTVNANGGAIMWKGEYGNITNSKFYNNSAPYAAGALRLDGSHVVVNNTVFDGNYDSKGNYSWGSAIYLTGNYTNITYSNFTNNYNSNNGTIAISGSNEMLENNIFINNSAYNGGAIYIRKNENVTFDYNTFTKNNAGNNGGAVFISDHANNTKILNSIFTDNKAIGYNISATNWIGNGGAVFFDTACHEGLIDNSTFTNNSANANGGAVMWNGNDGNITSSKFYNNSAPYAGGALRLSGNRLLVNDSVFEGNYDPIGSKCWGSAVYISGNNCNVTYSNFTNNKNANYSGAVYISGKNATLEHDNIENNSANIGGAVYISGNNAKLNYNNFTNNNALGTNGGAIYVSGENTTIGYSNLENNTAKNFAGAIYSRGSYLSINYCNLTFNKAKCGGAMYLDGSDFGNITGCNFTTNIAYSTSDNDQNAGGAIFWINGDNITVKDSYFFNCSCGKTSASGATNLANHGGAVNFKSNNNNLVENCTFENCFSEKDGGAMFYASSESKNSIISKCTFINCYSVFRSAGAVCWKENDGKIIDSKFINCSSMSNDHPGNDWSGKGGAMYFEQAQNNLLVNVSFINCSALYAGGAIFYRNSGSSATSNNTHINCTFINNSVERNGGALAFASANATYDGCTFINNTASNGGSICYSVNGGIIIRNSIFENNTNITNGGFIYINGSNAVILNNTFNNGSAENGGAIYVNTAVTINDSIFTNNTAENGGALYITKNTTLNNCNVTNNNATKGSGIYVNSGNLTLKKVKLIKNQANAKEFLDISDNVIGDKRSISGVFTGWDNYLNGIYVVTDNVKFEDVLYLGIDNFGIVGIVNTDDTSATIHNLLNESAQLIYLDIYGRDGSVQTLQNFTDEYGNFKFEFDNNADDSYKIYHLEDNYYTELVYTFNKNLVNITVNVTNITYGNSESIKINVTGNASDIPTGTVLVYLNSTLDGFTNRTYEATLEDGFVIIDDAPLDLLNVSTYDVYVRYIGDEHYLSGNATATFVVSNAKPSLNIGIGDYTYNETKTIIFDLIGINDEPITGKVIFNITGTESDGTLYSLTDIEINITRDEHGVIVNNTYELPVLNATGVDNNYEIVAFSPESTNYNSTNNSTTFKVFKAQPVINVTAYNITTDGMFAVDVHVEPEIANGTVNLIINTTEGKEYVLTLDDSKASVDLDKLPRGNYTVTATYNGDKNHNYPVSNSTKFEVLYDDFPIDIQLNNMTYGETQIISISVPKDYEGTLKIKFNGTELTDEYYTIEDGVIYIDTGDLTNVIEDGILVVGEYNLSVNYTPAENDYYRANSTDKLFNVTRADPNIIITTEEIGYLSNETITINLTSYNATGKINITVVNITEEGSTYTNYSVDINNDTMVTVIIPDLEIGTYNVIVEYCNDTNYNNKTFTENFKVLPLVISITLSRPEIYVDEFETIFGSVTDVSGRKVTTGKVNVTISNESGYITSYLVDVDSESGLYFTTNRYTINGTLYANATYLLEDKIIANTSNVPFKVNKIPTITNVTVINNKVENVTIDVVVRENATNYNNIIEHGTINITVNGVSKEYNITGATTRIVLNETVNITTTEELDFTVEYVENWKYLNSTGINSTNNEKITKIQAVPKNSTITVTVIEDTCFYGDTVDITGQVFDEYGNVITEGTVMVYINTDTEGVPVEISEVEGEFIYSLPYETSIAGINNVSVEYGGNSEINSSENETTFTVNKIPTITNVDILNNTLGNVTIRVNVTSTTDIDNFVTKGFVDVYSFTQKIILNPNVNVANNYVDIKLTGITTPGDVVIGVFYQENDKYNASNARNESAPIDFDKDTILIHVTKMPSVTNIEEILCYKVGNVTLAINVTNVTGQLVEDGHVIVTNSTDGSILGESNLVNGRVNITLNGVTQTGEIQVNVTFEGNDFYLPSNAAGLDNPEINITTINVIKQDAEISIGLNPEVLIVGENVYIRGTVTVNDVIIKEGQVNVTVNGENTTVEINSDGSYNLTYTAVSAGEYTVNATYLGNDSINPVTSGNAVFTVNKMPTNTTVSIVNNTVGHVVIEVSVTNSTGSPVSGKINVTFFNGTVIEEELDIDGKVNVTIPSDAMDTLEVNVTYLENDNYYSSVAINTTEGVSPDKVNTTVIGLSKLDSTISVDLNTTSLIIGESVKIIVNVTDADGNQITDIDDVVIYIDGVEIVNRADMQVVDGKITVDNVTVSAGTFTVNATYNGNDSVSGSNSNSIQFTVGRIPTVTNVTVTNHTVGNVTLNVSVEDKYGNIIKDGNVNITIAGNDPVEVELSGDDYTVVYLLDNMTSVGNISVSVEYTGNDTYLPSVANNTDDNKVLKNITVTPRNSSITVDVTPKNTTIGENVTINGQLVDEMGNNISNADLVIYVDGIGFAAKTNATGGYSFNYTTTRVADDIVVNATFDGGDNYNSTSANTTFNVTKIVTKTNVTIVNTTIGNVVIHVKVTNLTDYPVERGHVVVRNQTGQIVGEGELVNGGVDITLNVTTVGNIKVNVTYQENDIYYGSNATNSSLSDDNPEINITNIDVVKQEAGISIGLNPEVLIVGENVYIRGTVSVGDKFITSGQVNVTINGTNTTVNINIDGSYNLTYTAGVAGEYTVNATYLGNDSISLVTSSNVIFTVNKIPTNTTIKVLNNTAGNVTIEVTVTNSTGAPVSMGDIRVEFEDGTLIAEKTLTNGKANVTIPSANTDTLHVNVTYIENEQYMESKHNTSINVLKQIATITIEISNDNVTIGDVVTITGQVIDGMGNIINSGDVNVVVDGLVNSTTISDGKYTINNVTYTAGVYKVNATYKGNATVSEVTSETLEFTVNKMPTNVTISPISDVEVNKKFTIEVTLTNKTGDGISGKNITITVNDVALEGIPVTDADGKTSIKYTPRDNTDLVIKAIYLPKPDEVYLGNESETTVKVAMSQSTISVKVNHPDVYVGESVNISGTLKDGQGIIIANAPVTIYINGNIIPESTDANGNYSYIYSNSKADEYKVQAVYDGIANAIIGDSDTTSFTVQKMPTNVTITLPDEVEVFVPFDIEVTLTNNTDNHNPVSGKSIIIRVNGDVISNVPLTDNTGKTVVSYTPQNNDTIVVEAVFSEDNYYRGDNDQKTIASENIHISNSTITVAVNESQLKVGESVKITGNLTDKQGNSIPLANVKIYINEQYIDYVETNSTGGYSYVVNDLNEGDYSVLVIYEGIEGVRGHCNNTTSFNVINDKISTTTVVTILNNTAGNVTIDIKVTGEDGNDTMTGTVNITVNGHTIPVELTGTVNKTVKLDIQDSGIKYVRVEFTGNDNYLPSIGNNTETGKELTNITVSKQIATLTVNATPNNVTIGKTVTITGKLTDGMNNTIPDAYIEITLNGDRYITTTDSNGEYSLTNVTVQKEVVDVVAIYKGNNTVNATKAITNFIVDKIPTVTLVSVANTTAGNVSIDVIVIDNDGNVVTTGKLNITTEYDTFTVDISGQTTNIPLDFNTNGTKYVSVKYIENDVYYNSTGLDKVSYDIDPENAEIFNNITVTRQNTTITVTTITPVKVGNSTIISGKLVDEQSRPINGATVVVKISDKNYTVTTNANGEYSLEYNDTIVGTHNVTSIYNGNETFIGSNDTTNFEVEKRDAKISIEKLEDVPVGNDLNIIGKLEDEFGIPIKDTEINVTFDGKTQTVKTDDKGNFNASFQTDALGTKDVSIKFTGNENYTEASLEDTVNIVPIKAEINIDTPSGVEAGESINITGNVTDEAGTPLAGVPLNVTVNGETKEVITDENGRLRVPFDNVVPGQNNITVSSEDENYDMDEAKDKFFVPVLDTNITIDPIDDVLVGDDVTVSGRLLDENGKAVSGADVTVSVDGVNQTVVTDKDGRFNATFPTDSVGTKLVTVEYSGNDKYDGAKESAVFDVYKDTAVISLDEPVDVEAGEPVNITGTVVDENGNPVSGLPVNVTVNGETREVTTDKDGKFTVPFDNVVPGQNNITVSAGNDTVDVDTVEDKFFVPVLDTNITIDPIDDTLVGDDVTVSGSLCDENGKAVSGADVTVSVDGVKQTVQTDKNGKYTATFPTDSVGTKDVKVEYAGNEKYDSAKEDAKANVLPNNGTLSLELPTDAVVGEPTSINGTLTNQDGKAVPNTPVNVTVNGKVYTTTTDENGKFTVPVDNVVAGTNNIKVSAGNENITVKDVEDTFNADKQNSILTIDPISDAKMGDNITITGKLTDERGNPISDSVVTITVNGEEFNVTTDSEGKYELPLTNAKNGLNNVSVTYESDIYKSATNSTNFTLTKIKTIVTVDSIVGTVGEKITLVAHVTDENGNKVSGGNLVFKINGKTLRMDGRFDTNDTEPMKFKVVDGIVTYTMNVELYLREGKNITASYSGSYRYEEAKGNVASVGIRKRNAELTVEIVPNPAKQNSDTVFIVKLRDVTPNGTNKTCITTDAGLILKVNGITLKDEDGKKVYVKADSTTVTYTYHVPTGMAGVDNNGNIRNYTVEAVYNNSMFYPDTRNTSVFNVQRSIVNINFEDVTVKNNMLSVKGTFTDYENDLLVGNNKICVKINGITYKENNETKYFTVRNGIVDLSGIKIDSGTKVKSVTLVTGDTSAYLSARETTKDISTS